MITEKLGKLIGKFIIKVQNYSNIEQGSISDYLKLWISNKNSTYFCDENKLKTKQIIFVDFGLSQTPEMGYSHPALIIAIKNHNCTVIPCTSNLSKVNIAYHPIKNSKGTKTYYLLCAGNGGLSKNTAVDISQIRTISFSRIIKIFDTKGIDSTDYQHITELSFHHHFNYYQMKIKNLNKENSKLQMKLILINFNKEYDFISLNEIKRNLSSSFQLKESKPIKVRENKFEITFTLTDEYNQSESKNIVCISDTDDLSSLVNV